MLQQSAKKTQTEYAKTKIKYHTLYSTGTTHNVHSLLAVINNCFFQLPGKYKKSFHAENLLKNKKQSLALAIYAQLAAWRSG